MKSFTEYCEETLDEAMSMAQRQKAKNTFRKNKSKIKRGREMAKRKLASQDKLKDRARKQARRALEKKMLAGKDKADLSYAAREAIEKRLAKAGSRIEKLSKKLLPQVRKAELSRKRGSRKSED